MPLHAPFRNMLVVDDNAEICEVMASIIRDRGYGADMALSGAEALAKITSGDYHAVLCDIVMPGMSGVDLFIEVRSAGKDVPFIFITGADASDYLLPALRLGAYDFCEKPFDTDGLILKIDRVLDVGVRRERIRHTLAKLAKSHPELTTDLLAIEKEMEQAQRLHAIDIKSKP